MLMLKLLFFESGLKFFCMVDSILLLSWYLIGGIIILVILLFGLGVGVLGLLLYKLRLFGCVLLKIFWMLVFGEL